MKISTVRHDGAALTWIDGEWVEGNPPVLGPMTHATWMASVAFDGARAFNRLAPDLDLHCRRVIASAIEMGLKPPVSAEEIVGIAWDGIERFPEDAELYIRPLMYAEEGFVVAAPESTRFFLSVFEAPLPEPRGISACLSGFRRPNPDMAPTGAKTSCLYPNVARALREARDKGFDNAIMLDGENHVAEFATANLFMVKDGVVATPAANGTFLAGITRSRIITLLRSAGTMVEERTIGFDEIMAADEVFATGNYSKVMPATRIGERELQPGPVAGKARALYFYFAEKEGRRR